VQGATFFFNPADMPANSPFFGFAAPKSPATSGAATDDTIFQLLPNIGDCNPRYMPQALSSGALSVALLDGSVRLIGPTISPQTWGMALQPNDGLMLPRDWQ
jgi:hypothetical protein